MEILSKENDRLGRCYAIKISQKELDDTFAVKLQEAAKRIRLDGFRPGKAPFDVVKRMYGNSLIAESKKTAMDNACKKIIEDEKLLIAFDYVTKVLKEEDGIEFTMSFELVPTFELKSLSDIVIDKYVAEITEKEITEILEKVKENCPKWVEDTSSKKVKVGQKISADLAMEITINKKLQKKDLKNLDIIVEDKTPDYDFRKHLIGAEIGEVRDFSVKYPSDFEDKSIAGKAVHYKIAVKKIFKSEKHKLDNDFAKVIGHEDLEKAKIWAKNQAAAKYERISYEIMRRDILSKISSMYNFEVPLNMLDFENKEVVLQIKSEAKRLGKEFTPHIQEECRKIAEERVRLGFVVSQIAKKEKITITSNEIARAVDNIAAMYPGRERNVRNMYTSNRSSLKVIIGILTETKVVDFLLKSIKVNEKKCSVEKLISLDEEEFDFFKDSIPNEKRKVKTADKSKATTEAKKSCKRKRVE